MQMKYRRIIFYIFAVLFLISVPFILLYANGYRYNAKKNKFEKTGALIINTVTKNASLYLNGNYHRDGEEFRIQNLLPGEYEIKISKTGYFDWQKKLAVESKITTFAKDVRLISNTLPAKTALANAGAIYPAPDQSKFLFIKNEKDISSLFLFDAANDTEKFVVSLPLKQIINNIIWSPNNEKIILETPGGLRVINVSDGKEQALPPKIKIYNLRWDEAAGSQLLAMASDGIYKIDFLFSKASKIYSPAKNTNDFAVYQNNLYFISQSTLHRVNLEKGETVSIPLERSGYKMKSASKGQLILIDSKQHLQIFGLPLEKSSTPEILANAKNFDISGNNMLFYNDFELWTYNFGTGKKELITRFGEEIKKARWLSGSEHIILNFSDQIKIIELDKRDSRQIYGFPKFEQIGGFIINKKSFLYFTGNVNKIWGIYKLEL